MTDERDELDRWLESSNDESGPTPNPRFVRDLRAGLIAQAERTTPVMTINRRTLPAPAGRWLNRRVLLQLAAVMALIFAWIGTLAGGGPREITDRFGSYFQQQQQEEAAKAPSMYRGNNARTGVIDDSGPAKNPYVAWEITPAEPGFNVVNATETTILLAYEAGGRLVALDRADGGERWRYDSECQLVETTPAIVEGTVYVAVSCRGDFASSVIALDEVDGKEIWRSDFAEEVRTSPLIVDDNLYTVTSAHPPALMAINIADGSTMWASTIERVDQPGVTVPTEQLMGHMSAFSPSYGGGLIYVTSWDGLIHGVDAESGDVRWTFDTGTNSISTPSYADGTLYFSYAGITMTDGDFGFTALDAKSGIMLWDQELPVHIPYGGPMISGDLVFYSTSNGPGNLETMAWNRETGELRVKESVGGTSVIADDTIYLLDQRSGYVFTLNAKNGNYQTRAYVANYEFPDETISEARIRSEPIVQGGALIVASQASHLLVIESGTPDTALAANPTPLAGYDFSGLPACETPTPIDWSTLDGVPALSLVPTGENEKYGQPAAMHPDDIPAGQPVSESVLAEIESTVVGIKKCTDRSFQFDGSGFFSEDYFRRVWVRFRYENDPRASINSGLVGVASANDSTTTFKLPDGRIAQLTMITIERPVTFGYLTIFVQNGDRWVIDEIVQVTETPNGVG